MKKNTREGCKEDKTADNFFFGKKVADNFNSSCTQTTRKEEKGKEEICVPRQNRMPTTTICEFVQLKISLGKALLSQIINDYTAEKSQIHLLGKKKNTIHSWAVHA